MYPNCPDSPCDLDDLPDLKAVVDIVYNPARTGIILEAEKRGISCASGLLMLVAQAAQAVERYTGKPIDLTRTYDVTERLAASEQNIAIIGMPGCGKTRVMNTVGEILNLPVHISNAVQMATGNGLTGHSNAYLAALPGEVVEGMTTLHCGNFVFGIDEIDKAHMIADRSGNFQNELLSLTSDETSHNFKDNFLGFPIDASHLFIIMTANELDNLSEPLKSRCDIIEFPEPDANTIAAILAEHTVPSFLDKLRCNGKVIVDNNSVSYLVDTLYPKCKDIRKYQGIIESAISQSFLLAMRSDKQATVDANTIKPLVDSVFAKQSIRIGF